jgi:hypothetical protein
MGEDGEWLIKYSSKLDEQYIQKLLVSSLSFLLPGIVSVINAVRTILDELSNSTDFELYRITKSSTRSKNKGDGQHV